MSANKWQIFIWNARKNFTVIKQENFDWIKKIGATELFVYKSYIYLIYMYKQILH